MSIDDLTQPEVLALILAVISLLGGGIAWFMRSRRRVRARTLLDEVDEVYSRFKMNSRRCEAELYRLKDVTFEKLKAGKIDESSYDIIKERIGEYIHEIRERIVDERLGGFPGKLRDELLDMIKRGEISEKEYKTLGRLVDRTGELRETEKAQLRELLKEWKKDYEKDKAKLREVLERAILNAIMTGDVEQVKGLLKEDSRLVNARDEKGTTPLLQAATYGHAEVVELLIDKGAQVDARGPEGWTPLFFAAANGHVEVVSVLLARGAVINAQDEKGGTLLHYAAFNGHAKVVELLLAKGAEVNARTLAGLTASQFAAQRGHAGVVELLRRHQEQR